MLTVSLRAQVPKLNRSPICRCWSWDHRRSRCWNWTKMGNKRLAGKIGTQHLVSIGRGSVMRGLLGASHRRSTCGRLLDACAGHSQRTLPARCSRTGKLRPAAARPEHRPLRLEFETGTVPRFLTKSATRVWPVCASQFDSKTQINSSVSHSRLE